MRVERATLSDELAARLRRRTAVRPEVRGRVAEIAERVGREGDAMVLARDHGEIAIAAVVRAKRNVDVGGARPNLGWLFSGWHLLSRFASDLIIPEALR